ncbi:hypothetical protein BD413DRAFT_613508 [Trametes elegans]|nr:hypothetical protein BD413DRAFT_613508 [Trametes elegans]
MEPGFPPPKDVFVYAPGGKQKWGTPFATTWSTVGITERVLYLMVQAMLVFKDGDGNHVRPSTTTWDIVSATKRLWATGAALVLPGEYEVRIAQGYQGDFRPFYAPHPYGPIPDGRRDGKFAERVRAANNKCAITLKAASSDNEDGLQAAHICPVSCEAERWNWQTQHILGRDTTMDDAFLNTVANGVLLRADAHIAFDGFGVTVYRHWEDQWEWTVIALHPSWAAWSGRTFHLNRPTVQQDIDRLLCQLEMHFIFTTQSCTDFQSPF